MFGTFLDPCANFHCGAGKQCDIDENNKPKCVCIKQCPTEDDDRRKVSDSIEWYFYVSELNLI